MAGDSGAALVRRIGYVRVSMVAREEIISPAVQRAAILDDANRTGRQITGWIEDLDATGRHFKRRVMEAIAAVEAGEAAEIGVYRYDRWGRNALECLANVQRVEDAGGAVVSAMERVDVETTMGRFTRRMAFDLAELQSDQISDNWRGAHANRAGRGLPADGGRRFGYVRLGRVPDENRKNAYRRDPDDRLGERYEPDPETGPVLAALYERYAGGEPARALVCWLNGQGITTASGGAWTRDSLRRVLVSGFGAGLLRVHDPACRLKPARGKQCGRMIYIPGAHAPVISGQAWARFLAIQEGRQDIPARLRDAVHPLSGLLFCGASGHRLTVTRDAGGVAYRCPRRGEARGCPGVYVRAAVAEEAVLGWLSQWAEGIGAAAEVEAARLRTADRARLRTGHLAGQEALLQRQLARLMGRWAEDGQSEPEAYEIARAKLTGRLGVIREQMKAAARARAANTGQWQPVVAGLVEQWPTFSPARRRQMLGRMIARVEVHRTGVRKPPGLVIVPVWEDAG